MARHSVALADFKKLLGDEEFIDFFNKFICLPAFAQLVVYSKKRKKFLLHPPLPVPYMLNQDGLIEWLWTKRLNLFVKSRFFGEYRLCSRLIRHSLIKETGQVLKTQRAREVHFALKWFQRACLGRVSGVRNFRKFLYQTVEGSKLYQYWLDSEALYFHMRRRSLLTANEIFNGIKEKYFVGAGESKFPQHMLDMAWQSLPESYLAGIAADAMTYDVTFAIFFQTFCENRLKNYWMPRYLLQQNPHVEGDEAIYLDTARKYLTGSIKLIARGPPTSLLHDSEVEKKAFEEEQEIDPYSQDVDEEESEYDAEYANRKSGPKRSITIDSITDRLPPGISSSDVDVLKSNCSWKPDYSDSSSSTDEEEFRKKIEKKKARLGERKASRTAVSRKISDTERATQNHVKERESSGKECESITHQNKSHTEQSSESSDESDSAESWESTLDNHRRRKKKRENNVGLEERNRRRKQHKRKLKFEELLTKQSLGHPRTSSDKSKLFKKGRKDADTQKILDDESLQRRNRLNAGQSLKNQRMITKRPRVEGTVNTVGGKSLLKASIKHSDSSTASSPTTSPSTPDGEQSRKINRSPSLPLSSLDEPSRRNSRRLSTTPSETFDFGPSRVSFPGKIGKLTRRLGLQLPTSQYSADSDMTIRATPERKKQTAKTKPMKSKVPMITFRLSGDESMLRENLKRGIQSVKNKSKGTKAATLIFSLSGDEPTFTRSEPPSRGDRKKEKRPTSSKQLKRRLTIKKLMFPILPTPPTVAPAREYTMAKDNAYRSRPENKRMILALQSDQCASHPFRTFLLRTDNAELVIYLGFWQEVEKTRQDFQFGEMTFSNFMQSMHKIVTEYLLPSSPFRIEAPAILREESIKHSLSPQMQEMPWQIRKLQKEVMEDLKLVYEEFCEQETLSFLLEAAFRKDGSQPSADVVSTNSFLPPIYDINKDHMESIDSGFEDKIATRMIRSLRYIVEIDLPDGRDPNPNVEIDDDSDEDGFPDPPSPPRIVRPPSPDYKELATRSVKQYPDPLNPKGLKSVVKIPSNRRMRSATLFNPLRNGGLYMNRPMVRPRTFQDVLKDSLHRQFFKRYLKAHRAEMPLKFWSAVEQLRAAEKMKTRQQTAREIIRKYFHDRKVPATRLLQCSSDIIKDIPYLEVVTTTMLFSAQAMVGRVLEEKYFEKYAESFEAGAVSSPSDMYGDIPKSKSLLSRNGRLKKIWSVFIDFVKRAASFLRSMKKPHMFDLFESFLQREIENDNLPSRQESGHPREVVNSSRQSTIPPFVYRSEEECNGERQVIINGNLVNVSFLQNDLHFWRDIECYKNMAERSNFEESTAHSLEKEAHFLKTKANLIISCYLESEIRPKIRVNIPAEVADITVESLKNGLLDQALFHEATIYVFPLLLHFWKKFCAEYYRYKPTLSKKHRMIYGTKMTPAIAEQMKNKKKGIEASENEIGDAKISKQKQEKTKKSGRIDTADLPNYLNMDINQFTRRKGSPLESFSVHEMGTRLTFSIKDGVTLIEPFRRKKIPRPIVRGASFTAYERPQLSSRCKKRSMQLPPQSRFRRETVLDASVLENFAAED